ncbi:MAG TPA: glucose 1-dehydrogenase [Methylomirabilota bacterium]|nr:glucose 1-dehydrogenase [Methylomirabilota bacterium]
MTSPSSAFALDGRVCLVTGGGRGIGRETALAFAGAGAAVVVADVDRAAAKATVEAVEAAGRRALAITVNVAEAESVAAGVDEAARFGGGRLDILINNAGINIVKPTDELTLEEWQRVLAVNLTGVFLCSQAAARVMRRVGGGRIVNVASIYGLVGPPLHAAAAYAASKGGVVNLTRALAVEWARDGIRVNAVAPTHVLTEMTRARIDEPAWRARMLDRTPIGRVLEPADVVGAIVFLASPAAECVTGQVLAVDGGWLAE